MGEDGTASRTQPRRVRNNGIDTRTKNGSYHATLEEQNEKRTNNGNLSRFWTTDRHPKNTNANKLTATTPTQSPGSSSKLKRHCLERGILWEDPDFIPSYKLLPRNNKKLAYPIVWLRPHEITSSPRFLSSSRTLPLSSGLQGDHWMLLGLTTLATTPRLLERVVPSDQGFHVREDGYWGGFRFRFWQFGQWVEVCVDDRLPVCRGRPLGICSADHTCPDFWPSLVEKAYAKLYGGYDRLHQQGSAGRALQDLTGGIVQSFKLSAQERYLTYQVLNSAVPRSTLIVGWIDATPILTTNLLSHSAYDITGLARVRDTTLSHLPIGETPLVRLRGPFGRGHWRGPWSEGSAEWESLPERDKEILSVKTRAEGGEFWMSFVDFTRNFTHLELVHVGPDDWLIEPALQPRKPWRAVLAKRRWRLGYNAGGGPNCLDTTATNPQFVIQIPRGPATKCHVVVAVTQDHKESNKGNAHAIGFAIYEARPGMGRMTPEFVKGNRPLDVTQHSIAREVATFFALPPGEYVIVPQTKEPNCEGRFLLRVLTDEESCVWELNEDNMLYRDFTLEGLTQNGPLPMTAAHYPFFRGPLPPELDPSQLRRLLKERKWTAIFSTRRNWDPSLELCKGLIMLRDTNISGRLQVREVPGLLGLLEVWRTAFTKFQKTRRPPATSSYNLRPLLWEAGVGVSNKVLECLVLRFARDAVLTSDGFLLAMLRVHLGHERYHALETRAGSRVNPLSLEEMILMTIYS